MPKHSYNTDNLLAFVVGGGVGASIAALLASSSKKKACQPKLAVVGSIDFSPGAGIVNAAKLAVNRHNLANPTRTVVLDVFNTSFDDDKLTAAAKKIIDDSNYIGVIGPVFTSDVLALQEKFEAAKLPSITPSATNTALAQQGWETFHRVLGNDDQQASGVVRLLKRDQRSRVAVVAEPGAYSQGLYDTVSDQLPVTDELQFGSIAPDASDAAYDALAQKIMDSDADALFFAGFEVAAAKITIALRKVGSTAALYFVEGVLGDEYLERTGMLADGANVVSSAASPDSNPTFTALYRNSALGYGSDPTTYAAETYDATNVFLDAIKDGKCSREGTLEYLQTYDRPGVTKQIKFDANGEVEANTVYVLTVIDGSFESNGTI